MFKHILFPTDGAATNKHVIKQCLEFAKSQGSAVTALHVMPEYYPYTYTADISSDAIEVFRRDCIAAAEEYLGEIRKAAVDAAVPCDAYYVTSDSPYAAIVHAAEERKCDAIVMASHGRKGVKGMILGSETQKVLTHSKLPVLVFR